jgi:hypothetical protein
MTKLLEKAFAEAAKLTQPEQDALANWILEELASERRWEETFLNSSNVLVQMADDALAEYHAGQTEELDPDQL